MKIKSGVELLSETLEVGQPAEKGALVKVRLNGWLSKGESIRQEPISEFVIGRRTVITGLEYAVEGMRTGGVRKVKISPHLAYKEQGVPGIIPANALLIYEIELLGIAN
ncbi:MAG: FKBP-type peptidyl-prolyl cis-trans isomerase [Brachymonas sp.]|nr:FKBP-type peptidyl-prolyl cis-trans isomerase [Brachymonas sp.]